MNPAELEDGTFGVLRLSRNGVSWEGKCRCGERLINAYFQSRSAEQLREVIPFAKDLVAALDENHLAFETAISTALLELYNHVWRQPDEPVLSAAEFLADFHLIGFTIDRVPLWEIGKPDALATVSYDPDFLFGDHFVDVYVGEQLTPLHVDLA